MRTDPSLLTFLAGTCGDKVYVCPAISADEADRLRIDLGAVIVAMGLQETWGIYPEPPPPGRRGYSIWAVRYKGAPEEDARAVDEWAAVNKEHLLRAASRGLLAQVIGKYAASLLGKNHDDQAYYPLHRRPHRRVRG